MSTIGDFIAHDLGGDPQDLQDRSGNNLFNRITLVWSEPIDWAASKGRPSWPDKTHRGRKGFYAILRDHGLQLQRNEIQYIGIAKDLHNRLRKSNHDTARELVEKRGATRVAYGLIYGKGNHTESKLREIEDILIWVHRRTIDNDACKDSFPSMRNSSGKGTKRSRPWLITNEGYDFEGQMPAQIAYPWFLVIPNSISAQMAAE